MCTLLESNRWSKKTIVVLIKNKKNKKKTIVVNGRFGSVVRLALVGFGMDYLDVGP